MLITIIWDGDVTFEEATEGFKDSEITCMDLFCRLNPTVLQDGIPAPGEDEIWDMIADQEPAGILITKMINKFEEVEAWPLSRSAYPPDL